VELREVSEERADLLDLLRRWFSAYKEFKSAHEELNKMLTRMWGEVESATGTGVTVILSKKELSVFSSEGVNLYIEDRGAVVWDGKSEDVKEVFEVPEELRPSLEALRQTIVEKIRKAEHYTGVVKALLAQLRLLT
jgi:translation elongation factor EF-G